MTLEALAPYIVPALASIAVAWYQWRPKPKSPEELMREELTRMAARIEKQDASIEKAQSDIDDLRTQLGHIRGLAFVATSHILRWERHACASGIEVLSRPPELNELFER